MKKLTLLILSASLMITGIIFVSCSDNESNPPVATVPTDELINAPEQIEINGTELSISSYLWRDFMPPTPEDGRELAAVVYLETVDGSEFPGELDIDKMWVISKDDIWEATIRDESQSENSYQVRLFANGGPKWEIGIEVAVVVQIIDNDELYYLKETEVLIGQTF